MLLNSCVCLRLVALVLPGQRRERRMSARRLVLTVAAMGLIAALLATVTPSFIEMADALAAAQRTVDTAGPDALVVAAAGLLAWLVWAWGCLGLVLTAASALPGLIGGLARLGVQVVLPAGAPAGADGRAGGVPDWPAGPAAPATPGPSSPASDGAGVPDWPDVPAPADGSHVVVRGDCLWHIAEARLLERPGTPPADGDIARAVHAWWTANADVIGPDPDRLLPGQVLRPPDAP